MYQHDGLDLDGMIALRTGATLAYALPSVRLRIRCAERVVVEVRRPPFSDRSPDHPPVVASCAFRRAVASAHERWTAGERLSFLGLPPGLTPTIEVGLAVGERCLPGDLYRVRMGVDWLHLFATTMPVDRCKGAAGNGVQVGPTEARDARPGRVRVGFHRDAATDVTLVHVASPAGEPRAAAKAVDALQGVLGRCLAAELVDGLPAVR
jgi:hypothetical protein